MGIRRVPNGINIIIDGHLIDSDTFTDDDITHIYDTLWRGMERENNLINHRIGWMLWITSAFITAQAFLAGSVIRELAQQNSPVLQGVACWMMAVMSASALYATQRAKNAVEAAVTQVSYLKYFYLRTQAGDKNLFEHYFHLPRPFGDPSGHKSGNKGSKAFPPMIVGLWFVLVVVQTIAGAVYITVAAYNISPRSMTAHLSAAAPAQSLDLALTAG